MKNSELTVCYDKGNLKKTNLNERQPVGKKILRNKVIKNKIFIANTDKSGKYVLTKPEIYKHAENKHVEKDLEVGWQEVKPTDTAYTWENPSEWVSSMIKLIRLTKL